MTRIMKIERETAIVGVKRKNEPRITLMTRIMIIERETAIVGVKRKSNHG